MEIIAHNLIIEDDLVKLEPLQLSHLDDLWEVAQDRDLWAVTTSDITNKGDLKNYISAAIKMRDEGIAFPFAIYHKQHKKFIGSTRYGNISPENNRLEIGWTWYAKEVQGTGMNQHIKLLLLQYAFETLGVVRTEIKTDLRNLRSQNAIKKIGGTQEGILRKHILLPGGIYRDTVYFSILDNEWPYVKQRLLEMMHNQPKLL